MKHLFILRTIVVFSFASFLFSSYTSNTKRGDSNIGNDKNNNVNCSVVYVSPNPKSGVLNIGCTDNLHSPLNVKVLSINGVVANYNSDLIAEGVPNHKFVQIVTNEIPEGKYTVLIKDANGIESKRVLYLQR